MVHARSFCLLVSLSFVPALAVATSATLPGASFSYSPTTVPGTVISADNDNVPAAETTPVGTGTQLPTIGSEMILTPEIRQQLAEAAANQAAAREGVERQQQEAEESAQHNGRRRQNWEERFQKLEADCQAQPSTHKCQAHFAGVAAKKAGGSYWEGFQRYQNTPIATPTTDPSQNPAVTPTSPTNTGRETPTANPTQTQPAQTASTQTSPESTRRNAYDQSGSRLRETLQNIIGTAFSPTPTPSAENQPKDTSAAQLPAAATTPSIPTEMVTPDPEVSTGVAYAAVQCHRSAMQAAQACNASLQRAQSAAVLVQRAQLAAQSGTPTGCASVGNASAEATMMIHQEQQACAQVLGQCRQACASSESQVANARGSVAALQSAEGSAVCSAAQSTAASIGVNQTQIQAAYGAAAQCYQQTTGTEFTPTTGGAALRRAAADFGKAMSGETPQSNCPGGVCAADAGAGSQQLPDAKKLLGEDEGGGGGRGATATGGGYKEAHNLPDFNSRFQATGPQRPAVAAKPGAPGVKPAAPGKNPGFFIKDQEAERRAREFANLPKTRGVHADAAGGGRLAQKPGLERFVRRPAQQPPQGIGAKHTNIFTTITQSYARYSDRLMP